MKLPLPINTLRDIFKRHNVMVAYLFGSQAHGTAGPLSDIDIAILFDRSATSSAQELNQALSMVLMTDHIDVLDLSKATDPLLKHRAVFSGECLYSSNRQTRFQLERSIMQEYEDTRNLRSTQYYLMQQRLATGTFGTAVHTSPYVQQLLHAHVAN